MSFLFFLFYEYFLWPLALPALYIASCFVPKIREGFRLRAKDSKEGRSLQNCVWIHVSSGEWEYARPLARELKAKGQSILVTHFSPSVRSQLEKSPEVDCVVAAPLDHGLFVRSFFARFRPKIMLVSRTDLWPVLLREAKNRGIPRVLFSARLSQEVLNSQGAVSKSLFRFRLNLVEKIFCVSDEDRRNFDRLLGGSRVKALGDTRYDQVLFRLKNAKTLKPIFSSSNPIFVAGSTWPADEAVLLPAFSQLQHEGLISCVVVPHEPTPSHLSSLKEQFRRLNIEMVLYSEAQDSSWSKPGRVLVVDQMGILAEIYGFARLAFVGNSFERPAIHSVMEPLAAGCVTFVGPYHQNNREALDFQKVSLSHSLTPVQIVRDSRDLVEKVKTVLKAPSLESQIKNEVLKRTGASQRILSELPLSN